MAKQHKRLTRTKTILLGFVGIILVGTALLMLPFATRAGQETSLPGALFTSVSSTCVIGLVVYDTWSHWTLFGQLVILTLVQIGGLGFITISTFTMILLRKKIGISRRALIQDSLNTLQIRGSTRLVQRVVIGTLIFEGTGAVLLALRFVPELGFSRGCYYGLFHAVSAFCNAGFDLMGFRGEYSSFCSLWNDSLVLLTLSGLTVIGGIGFVVWEDLLDNKWRWKRYHFHTKAVLLTTGALILGAAGLFLLLERNGLFRDMCAGERLLSALFCAVSPRTAGFVTLDTAAMSNGSFLVTLLLIFVGGSPGSTAGGVKTTTIFAVLLYLRAYVTRQKDCTAFHGRLDTDAVKKASVVIFINLLLILGGCLALFAAQELPLRDTLLEVISACCTTGMSTGLTRELCGFSLGVVMLLMFCGRMGSLTFAMSFTEHRKTEKIRYPQEKITIG